MYVENFDINLLKTSPEDTQAGVYGKCVMLYQNQIMFYKLKKNSTTGLT